MYNFAKKKNNSTDTTVYVVDEGERQLWSETEWISPPIIVVLSDNLFVTSNSYSININLIGV